MIFTSYSEKEGRREVEREREREKRERKKGHFLSNPFFMSVTVSELNKKTVVKGVMLMT